MKKNKYHVFNKIWINSYETRAAQHKKFVDLEEHLPLEPYQVLCQFYRELRGVDGEIPCYIYLKYKFPCPLKCVHIYFLSLVYPTENNFIQSVISKELYVIFKQFEN